MELDVRARGAAALELGLAPALRPQKRGGEQVAAQLRGLRPGRPLHLHAQEVEQGSRSGRRPPPARVSGVQCLPREQPAPRAGQPLVVEAHDVAAHALGALELVHLPLRDHRQRVRPELHRRPVDQVPAGALAHPDQLVVGVPVRLANLVALDAIELERTHLQRVGFGGQIVDRGLSHLAHCRESAHEPRCLPPRAPAFRPVAGASAGPSDGPSGRRAAVGEARRLQQRPRLRRQQDAQARVPGGGRAREGLRHARLDRRRPVEPHAAGGGGGGAPRARLRARAGELGRLAGRDLRPRRQHPALAHHGRRRPARGGRLRDRLQGELGAGARGRGGGGRQALRHPRRRLRPRARRPRLRALGPGAGRAGARARRVLRHGGGLLGHRQHPGRDDRRLRGAGGRAARDRDRRLRARRRRRASRWRGSRGARQS